jgi:hypothetical protein
MKKVLLTKFPKELTAYNSFYMLFVDKNLDIVPGKYTSCRETFCAGIRRKYNIETQYSPPQEICATINTSKFYVLITFGKKNNSVTKKQAWDKILGVTTKSLKIINSFERHYKWPLSKIKLVDSDQQSVCIPSTLFVGNRKWGASPYLVSFYLLLTRLGRYPWITDDVVNEDSHNKLVNKLEKLCDSIQNKCVDAMHISRSLNMAKTLMADYDRLFKGKPNKYHWSIDRINVGNGYSEGIRTLAEGKTHHKELLQQIREK